MSKSVFDAINIALLPAFQLLRQFACDPERAVQYQQLEKGLEKAAGLLSAEYPELATAMRYGFAVCAVSALLERCDREQPESFAPLAGAVPTTVRPDEAVRARNELNQLRSHAAEAIGLLIPHALASLRMAAESPERIVGPSIASFNTHARRDAAEYGQLSYNDSRDDVSRAAAWADLIEPHIADYLRIRLEEYNEIAAASNGEMQRIRARRP